MKLGQRIAKSKRLESVVAWMFATYLRFCFATTRWRYLGTEALNKDLGQHGAVIVICWHQKIMFSAPAWAVTQNPLAGLHSQSRAGRLAGAIQHRLGLTSVAMHDKKSNRATSLAVARLMKTGTSLGLAADGPTGPARLLNPAVLEWARLSGKPIWFQTFAVRRHSTWSSWDALHFPWPFTRGVIAYAKCPTDVPRKFDGETGAALALEIAAGLTAHTDTADRTLQQ